MSLETKHGPLPGRTPAVIQVASYLRRVSPCTVASIHLSTVILTGLPSHCVCSFQIMSSKKEEDVTMRKLVYSLLAPTGDAISQKVTLYNFFLANCFFI